MYLNMYVKVISPQHKKSLRVSIRERLGEPVARASAHQLRCPLIFISQGRRFGAPDSVLIGFKEDRNQSCVTELSRGEDGGVGESHRLSFATFYQTK